MMYVVTMKHDNRQGASYCMLDEYHLVGVFDTEEKAIKAGEEACKSKKWKYTVFSIEKNVNYFDKLVVGYSHYFE